MPGGAGSGHVRVGMKVGVARRGRIIGGLRRARARSLQAAAAGGIACPALFILSRWRFGIDTRTRYRQGW